MTSDADGPQYSPAKFQRMVLGGVTSLGDPMASEEVLRPSASGQCPPRLWYKQQLAKKGQPVAQENVPDRQWSALQGNVMEEMLRAMLRAAGAQVLDPPDEWASGREPETAMDPHCDGALLWPEAGITEWTIIESKHLRSTESRKLIVNGLRAHRLYFYQSVSYVLSAETLVKKAGWEIPTPKQLLMVLMPKDPSTTKMFIGQSLKLNQGETAFVEGDKLTKTQEKNVDPVRVKWKQDTTTRLEEYEGAYPFYNELIRADEQIVEEVWEDILRVRAALDMPWAPEPIHDPFSTELDDECDYYCEVADLCRQTILKQMMSEGISP